MSEKPPAQGEPGRRSLLVMLASFAVLTLLVVGVSVGAAILRSRPPPPPVDQTRAEVLAFLGPLAQGERFEGFRIARIEPSQPGRITLSLEAEGGEHYLVDVLARSTSGPEGIGETDTLAVYARTRGETPEAVIHACTALANALRAREEAGKRPPHLEHMGGTPM